MAWPDGGLNEVVKTVGATARDHSTLAAWEAETDEDCTAGWGAGDYADPCSPVGDCYDDADFDESFYPRDAVCDATYYRTLTVHAGERHDGTDGEGVRLIPGTTRVRDKFFVWEWFITSGAGYIEFYNAPDNSRQIFRNLVFAHAGLVNKSGIATGTETIIRNCFFQQPYTANGLTRRVTYCQNCSMLLPTNCYMGYGNTATTNCIASGASANSGAFFLCTGDYNIGRDTSAPGANSVDNVAAADIFTNTGSGTEDLHLKSDSTDASAAGSDLSASFTDDIDGDTRSDWDIGADEYDSGGGGLAADIILTMWMKRRKYSLIER